MWHAQYFRNTFASFSEDALLFSWQALWTSHDECIVILHGRRNTFATFSVDVLHFSWQAQHFGRVHRHFSWQAQHFRRVVLRVFVNRIGRAASSGDKVQIPWQAWHFVRCAEN